MSGPAAEVRACECGCVLCGPEVADGPLAHKLRGRVVPLQPVLRPHGVCVCVCVREKERGEGRERRGAGGGIVVSNMTHLSM